jgi:HD-GYP domain-containing protein (c-di-GMP phosphodiesterase class II)
MKDTLPDTAQPGGETLKKAAAHFGEPLVMAFAAAVRTAAYYNLDNAVMKQASALLFELIWEQGRGQELVSIACQSRSLFVNAVRVRSNAATFSRFASAAETFERWGIESIAFHPGLHEEELAAFLVIVAREKEIEGRPLENFLEEQGIQDIVVDRHCLGTGHESSALTAIQTYSAAINLFEELEQTQYGIEKSHQRQVRHVIQALVDEVLRSPEALIGLTTVKEHESYLLFHSTNVAILSVLIGQRLALRKSQLGELCLAAFMHDIGKLKIPSQILDKPGKLTPSEFDHIKRHPVLAASFLLKNPHITTTEMRAVVVAFEHHRQQDQGGYPRTRTNKSLSLFGRIVTIADVYDALTTARPYRPRNITPYEAVVYLIEKTGSHFDPLLVRIFLSVVGLYPPGSLIQLTTGEIGIVQEPPAVGKPVDRPIVRLWDSDTVVDLSEVSGGWYVRSVRQALNPANSGQIPTINLQTLEWAATT